MKNLSPREVGITHILYLGHTALRRRIEVNSNIIGSVSSLFEFFKAKCQ
jgi:hypothetical protein